MVYIAMRYARGLDAPRMPRVETSATHPLSGSRTITNDKQSLTGTGRGKKFIFSTSEAYICMKTKGLVIICPKQNGHLRQIGAQSMRILVTRNGTFGQNCLGEGELRTKFRSMTALDWATTVCRDRVPGIVAAVLCWLTLGGLRR